MSSQEQQERAEQAVQAAGSATTDPAVLAAGGSVLLSLYLFFIRGNREMGTFVGLWPPTIFAFTSYFNQTRMSTQLDRAMGRSEGMRDTVERIIGSQ